MNDGKICVSVCGTTTEELITKMNSADKFADVIEIRFDCLEPAEVERLLDRISDDRRELLITFRPAEEGGRRSLTREERIAFWRQASAKLKNDPLVDHELDINFPTKIAENRVIRSAHFFGNPHRDISEVFKQMSVFQSSTLKIAMAVNDAADAIDVWKALSYFEQPCIPIAMGEAGKWTRILGPAFRAPLTYASLDGSDATAPGQITAHDLRNVFRVKELSTTTHIYALLAGDTTYSLSPYMHNAAFNVHGLDAVFVPMQTADLGSFMRRMVNSVTREVDLNFRGFSVTNPHKRSVMRYLDGIDDAAQDIGAVNTVKIENGRLHGYNTDAPGFVYPLKEALGDLRGARVAVVGAGGAARACVYALKEAGAEVQLLARDAAKASAFAADFNIESRRFSTDLLDADILVNTTPLGTRGADEDQAIATAEELRNVKLVYDLVYNPLETRLLREAKAAGARTLGGLDMLIAQGALQFEIWTGTKPRVELMRSAVAERLQ